MRKGADLIALPSVDPEKRVDLIAPYGSSIAEVVQLALPGASEAMLAHVRVTINDEVVAREFWASVRLRPKNDNMPVVVVRVVPSGGGMLRAALSIAVGVAALALGQVWAVPALTGVLGATGASIAGGVITATTLLAGQFLINALIPQRGGGLKVPEAQSYSISGMRNVANPDGNVPFVMGYVRYAPPYAALSYTEAVGFENYIRALFVVSAGKVELSDHRLGDTPIDRYKEVELETFYLEPGDPWPSAIFPNQIIEERLTIDLNRAYVAYVGEHTRFSASDSTAAILQFSWPNGLYWMHTTTSGSSSTTTPLPIACPIRVLIRENGVGSWIDMGEQPNWAMVQKPLTADRYIEFPHRGRWEIMVVRGLPDYDDLNAYLQNDQIISVSYWTSIKSIRPEAPVSLQYPATFIAMRVRATKQLNGAIDSYNVLAKSVVPDWDGANWIERASNNPASLMRYAMQGPGAHFPLDDDEIDLAGLEDFHEKCTARGHAYNRVHDFDASVLDVASDICAAGRAAPRDDGEKWGVIIDERKTQVIAHMSPRNSWGFSVERPYIQLAHAFGVSFMDETNFYKPAKRIIPFPGFVGTPTVIEEIELPGITDPAKVWVEARKRQYEILYRPDTFIIQQDYEGAIAVRGDPVELSHDVLDLAQTAARVKFVEGRIVVLDNAVRMETGKTYGIRIRRLGPDDASPDESIVRLIETDVGETTRIRLKGDGIAPAIDEMIHFGEASRITYSCRVKGVEATEDFGRRFSLVLAAEEIFDLVEAEVVPSWNGRFGSLGDFSGYRRLETGGRRTLEDGSSRLLEN